MATPNSLVFLSYFVFTSLFLNISFAFEVKTNLHTHILHLSSLVPSSVCSPSTAKGSKKKGTLDVVHKHGPCFQLNQENEAYTPPNITQILLHDQIRVNSIHSEFDLNGSKFSLPAKYGVLLDTSNFIVTVGLGSPTKQLSLVFDTGSSLTWTQCQPCLGSCYAQQEPIFDTSKSSSYSKVSCDEAACNDLASSVEVTACSNSSTCLYGVGYGDGSTSQGSYAKDTLTLTSSDQINNFLFGCGQYNRGLFGRTAGLLGLGPDKSSFVEQTAQTYGKFFSYCLPSNNNAIGHLSFGERNVVSNNIKFAPLTLVGNSHYYGIDITGISVGGVKLSIPTSVFSNTGTMIDSGTVITRLPPSAYSILSTEFRKQMSNYPSEPYKVGNLTIDTCYDLRNYETIALPTISIHLNENIELPIDPSGILFNPSQFQFCLAFLGNEDDTEIAIFGNHQHTKYEVVHDVAGGRIGFGLGGCS